MSPKLSIYANFTESNFIKQLKNILIFKLNIGEKNIFHAWIFTYIAAKATGAQSARSNASNAGKDLGKSLNNSKVGQAVNKSAVVVGKVFVDYGKAINKAAQQTMYGNMKSPEAISGGAFAVGIASKSISSAAKGGAVGLLGEFAVRSVINISKDVFGFGKFTNSIFPL